MLSLYSSSSSMPRSFERNKTVAFNTFERMNPFSYRLLAHDWSPIHQLPSPSPPELPEPEGIPGKRTERLQTTPSCFSCEPWAEREGSVVNNLKRHMRWQEYENLKHMGHISVFYAGCRTYLTIIVPVSLCSSFSWMLSKVYTFPPSAVPTQKPSLHISTSWRKLQRLVTQPLLSLGQANSHDDEFQLCSAENEICCGSEIQNRVFLY